VPSTTASWARSVRSWEEIPSIFKEFVCQLEPFPYIIDSPADNWGKKCTNHKLICMYQEKIIVLELIKNRVTEVCYWFKDIQHIEQGKMLLYSWIGIHGMVGGKLAKSIVEYNSVVAALFEPIAAMIRQVHLLPNHSSNDQNLSQLNFLKQLNYKFFNYASECILPGEKIMDRVYQCAIYEKRLRVFTRSITLAHLTILTDKEIIIIKEEEIIKVQGKYDFKNGGVWAYIPVDKIINMNIHVEGEKGLLALAIGLQENSISLLFSSLQQQDLQTLVEAVTVMLR